LWRFCAVRPAFSNIPRFFVTLTTTSIALCFFQGFTGMLYGLRDVNSRLGVSKKVGYGLSPIYQTHVAESSYIRVRRIFESFLADEYPQHAQAPESSAP
jgi:hypothetical protein